MGLLISHLNASGIPVRNVTFLKRVSPRDDQRFFRYCCLISIDLAVQDRRLTTCLNVIQDMRGKEVPGQALFLDAFFLAGF